MAPKVVSGARAIVHLFDPSTNQTEVIGIWNSFSYHVTYDVAEVFILGRYSAAELNTTAVEPVAITAGGWRVMGNGPYAAGRITVLQDLLQQQYLQLAVYDRQTNQVIANIQGCLPTGFSSGLNAKQLMDSSNTYKGLLYDDESVEQNEAAGAADLP